jgi:hypothetical protein
MKRITQILMGLALMAVFAGCGEGFRAMQLSTGSGDQAPVGETPESVDEEILNGFAMDLLGLDEGAQAQLSEQIGAFELELEMTSHPGGASDVLHRMTVSIMGPNCDSNVVRIENTNMRIEQLTSRAPVMVGAQGQYSVIVTCTSMSCNEMVATVNRTSNDQSTNAMAFIGLISNGTQNIEGQNNRFVRRYRSRTSGVFNFITPMSLEQKIVSCSVQTPGEGTVRPVPRPDNFNPVNPVDPVGPVNPIDPTQGADDFVPAPTDIQANEDFWLQFDGTL